MTYNSRRLAPGPRTTQMPRDARTRRLTRPSSAAGPTSGRRPWRRRTLVSLLAHTPRLVDLLPQLHQHALDVTGGSRSLLFEHNPATARCRRRRASASTRSRPIRGRRPPTRRRSSLTRSARRAARRRRTRIATCPTSRRVCTRARRCCCRSRAATSASAWWRSASPARAPASLGTDVAPMADAFLMALELARLRQRDQLQRDLRLLLDEFAQSLSATLQLTAGLDIFCHGANRLFGADRTSVWIHDRRARQLVLRASTDPAHAVTGVHDPRRRSAVAGRRSPCGARAPRFSRGDSGFGDGAAVTSTVTVPLRGCRRALGTVVFEGVRVEPGGEMDLLDRADELGRQLSNAIENLSLLDDVMRSQQRAREHVRLDRASGRGVRSARPDRPRQQRVRRARRAARASSWSSGRSTDFIGPELAAWLAELAAGHRPGGRPRAGDARDRRFGVERAVHGDGDRSARIPSANASAASSSRAI